MVNKKGQEMSVSTLVLIVIGIVVLVMLILGFTLGWQNLWNKINVFQGGGVEDVISGCKIAATADATYSYCSEFKSVEINKIKMAVNCAYPEIQNKLDKQLTCEGDPAKKYCDDLCKVAGTDAAKKALVNTTIVNGNPCPACA